MRSNTKNDRFLTGVTDVPSLKNIQTGIISSLIMEIVDVIPQRVRSETGLIFKVPPSYCIRFLIEYTKKPGM